MTTLPPRRPRRWMPIALIVSLATNMFLGGLILSHAGRRGPPHGPPGPERFIEHLAATLPPDDGALLRRALEANRDTLNAEHALHESMPQKIRAALLAEPFDPAALVSVFTDNDTRERDLRQRMQRALADAAAAMSPEGRRQMAEFRPRGPGR
ncbi:periplasmic heavy metal sensor [Azospirillum sp. sgz301742]